MYLLMIQQPWRNLHIRLYKQYSEQIHGAKMPPYRKYSVNKNFHKTSYQYRKDKLFTPKSYPKQRKIAPQQNFLSKKLAQFKNNPYLCIAFENKPHGQPQSTIR